MKRILTTLSQKWPEYLLEILVLIIGIYGAFALDEWNSGRKEQRERIHIISNLNDEFTKNQQKLDEIQIIINDQIQALRFLMGLIGKSKEEILMHNIDSIFYVALDIRYYAPTQHTIKEISNQGQIKLIGNKQLKTLLYDWGGANDLMLEGFSGLDDKVEQDIMQYLMDKYPVKDIDQYGFLHWPEPSVLQVDKTFIFNDLAFENQLDDLLYRVQNYKNSLDEVAYLQKEVIKTTATAI